MSRMPYLQKVSLAYLGFIIAWCILIDAIVPERARCATAEERRESMSELLIGTQSGVFRLGNDGNLQQEDGPSTVAFLTRAHEGVLALTQQGPCGVGPVAMGGNWRTNALLRRTSGPLVLTTQGRPTLPGSVARPAVLE